jgi:threonine synthase
MSELLYRSTRGEEKKVTSARAILNGLAGDGGLYVPEAVPRPDFSLSELPEMTYTLTAQHILRAFLTDYSDSELHRAAELAYGQRFRDPAVAPLVNRAGAWFLELFHGPTLAFKDMALTILPHLLKDAAKKSEEEKEIVILTATSGDTGKAALEGFAGVEGTRIVVYFPEHGVSPIQKRQMTTQEGENTHVIGIGGNFDDAQAGVKKMFADSALAAALSARGLMFSSANSINIGRLVPQVAYYFYAYGRLLASGDLSPGEEINFAVPTGNFGNILAGYYARRMGLPLRTLICASNQNNVLSDFFATGVYDRNREFFTTMSPSMDILVSSNLERLLYHAGGDDAGLVAGLMRSLASRGRYRAPESLRDGLAGFHGGFAGEEETARAIKDVFDSDRYVIDPHTAVAYAVWRRYRRQSGDTAKTVIVSTASPFKFPVDVIRSIEPGPHGSDDFALTARIAEISGLSLPPAVSALSKKPVRHRTVCRKEEMEAALRSVLGLNQP